MTHVRKWLKIQLVAAKDNNSDLTLGDGTLAATTQATPSDLPFQTPVDELSRGLLFSTPQVENVAGSIPACGCGWSSHKTVAEEEVVRRHLGEWSPTPARIERATRMVVTRLTLIPRWGLAAKVPNIRRESRLHSGHRIPRRVGRRGGDVFSSFAHVLFLKERDCSK